MVLHGDAYTDAALGAVIALLPRPAACFAHVVHSDICRDTGALL